jgi:cell division transport system permease protein
MLFAKDAQQAADQALILRKVTELSLTPGMNCQDGFLTSHLERQATAVESRRVIDVYLADRTAPAVRAALERGLAAIEGVAGVRYVSKEEALASFRATISRGDLVDALGYNPLPASFRLELAEGARTAPRMRAIAAAATRLAGVEDVRYGGEWVERLDATLVTLRLVDLVAAALVGLAVAFAVGSTIRLTVLARSEMIEIMKAVGAGDAHIRTPFLVEGLTQSLAAALLSLGATRLAAAAVGPRLGGGGIAFLGPWEIAGFLGFAAVAGLAGAFGDLGAALRRTS